jgi:hypothetical protein
MKKASKRGAKIRERMCKRQRMMRERRVEGLYRERSKGGVLVKVSEKRKPKIFNVFNVC